MCRLGDVGLLWEDIQVKSQVSRQIWQIPVRREARLPRGQVNRLQGPALTGAPLSSFSTVVSFAKPSSFVDILFRKEYDTNTNQSQTINSQRVWENKLRLEFVLQHQPDLRKYYECAHYKGPIEQVCVCYLNLYIVNISFERDSWLTKWKVTTNEVLWIIDICVTSALIFLTV